MTFWLEAINTCIKPGNHQISFIAKNSNAKQMFIDGLLGCSLEYSREHTTTKYAVEIHGNDDNRYRIQIDDGHQETFESHDNFVQYIKTNRDKCISKMTLFLPQLKYEILDKVVLHDAQCFNYSDHLNEVIIDGCYNSCILVVIMSSIGKMGYQEERFLKKLIGSCKNIFKVIFIFTGMDRVPKNEKLKNQHHHTDCANKLMTTLHGGSIKWEVVFVETKNDRLDDFKSMLPNNQSVNGRLEHILPSMKNQTIRNCTQFPLMRTNDVEYNIEKQFPELSRFDKLCLVLLIRFVTCMFGWNGWFHLRQIRFPKLSKRLLNKYRRDHWHTQVFATLSDTEHERFTESQYFDNLMTSLGKYLLVRGMDKSNLCLMLVEPSEYANGNSFNFNNIGTFIKDVWKCVDVGLIRSDYIIWQLIDKLEELCNVLDDHLQMAIELRNNAANKIMEEQTIIKDMHLTLERIIIQSTADPIELLSHTDLQRNINSMITSFDCASHRCNDQDMIIKMKDNVNQGIIQVLQTHFKIQWHQSISILIDGPFFTNMDNLDFTLRTDADVINIDTWEILYWSHPRNIYIYVIRNLILPSDQSRQLKQQFQKCINSQLPLIIDNICHYYMDEMRRFEGELTQYIYLKVILPRIRQVESDICHQQKLVHIINFIDRLTTNTRHVIAGMKLQLPSTP